MIAEIFRCKINGDAIALWIRLRLPSCFSTTPDLRNCHPVIAESTLKLLPSFQCFFCVTEESFDRLCLSLSARLIRGHATPMFEIREKAPPLFQDEFSTGDERCQDPPTGSDDDEFEIL